MANKFVEVYEEIAKIPELIDGRILYVENENETVDDGSVSIQITWKLRNLPEQKFYTLENNILVQGQKVHRFPTASLAYNIALRSISPTGKKIAQILKNDEKEILEIGDAEAIATFIDLQSKNTFGKVYCDPYISCLEWSTDETKVAFLAEEARPSGTTFYSKENRNDEEKGEKYLFREDWGEQMSGQHQGVIVVVDVETENATVIHLPKNTTPGQLVWRPHSHTLVGVGYLSEPFRIGIAYCSDRESFLFEADLQGFYKEITPRGQHVKSPRFSPSGKKLVFLQSTIYGNRAPAAQIAIMDWAYKKVQILLDYIKVSQEIFGKKFFPGVCGKTIFPKRCFDQSEKRIWFSAFKVSNYVTYAIDIDSKEIAEATDPSEYSVILDVFEDFGLFLKSSITEPDQVYLSKLVTFSELPVKDYLPLTVRRSLQSVQDDWCHVMHFKSPLRDRSNHELMLSAIYVGPPEKTDKSVAKRPLICWPHGGPHSVIGNRFSHVISFLVSIGYSVVLPNYRGSIGHGNDFLTASLGQCGEADVQDCIQAVEEVLSRFGNVVDKEQLYLIGFSHGGFLTLHLASKYPNLFKAQATLNPASDIYIMAAVSDIPEWAYLEFGLPFALGRGFDLEAVSKMFKISPIHHVDRMKVPTLFLLGEKDARVPHSQGIGFYKMLLARNVKTRVYMYDDDHPLSKLSSESDYVIQIAKWFEEHS